MPALSVLAINQSYEYMIEQDLPTIHYNCIFIALEEESIVIFGDTSEIPEIEFGDLRSVLLEDYKILNARKSDTMIQYATSKSHAKYLFKNFRNRKYEQPSTKLIYHANDVESEATNRIVKKIYKTIEEFFWSILPESPKRQDLTNVKNSLCHLK